VYFLYDTFEVLKWILAVSALIILTVIFLLNRIITNAILKPVNKLIDKMKTTDDTSKYTKIEMNRKNTKELRELSGAYNEMMMGLQTHDEKQQAFIKKASKEQKTPSNVISSYSQMIKGF